MKMLKIAGLLFITSCINNIQPMDIERGAFPVEQKFLQGQMSAHEYLSYLASLSPDYAYKIRAIRNAQVDNPEESYEEFIIDLDAQAELAQRLLGQGETYAYNIIVRNIQRQIMRKINKFYKELKENVDKRHGREH